MKKDIIKIIKKGGVGIIPTDTIYGIAASVFSEKGIERIYKLKSRDEKKSLIIVISSIDDLQKFGVEITEKAKNFMEKYWPGKVSIVLPFNNKNLSYLDKAGGTLAFRLPNKPNLIEILKEIGPLATTSVNPEGMLSAKNIEEAKKYFDGKIDFYVDEGDLVSEPSTLVKIDGDKIEVLRQGAVRIV